MLSVARSILAVSPWTICEAYEALCPPFRYKRILLAHPFKFFFTGFVKRFVQRCHLVDFVLHLGCLHSRKAVTIHFKRLTIAYSTKIKSFYKAKEKLRIPSPRPFCMTGKRLYAKVASISNAVRHSPSQGSKAFKHRRSTMAVALLVSASANVECVEPRITTSYQDIFYLSLQQTAHFGRLRRHSYWFDLTQRFVGGFSCPWTLVSNGNLTATWLWALVSNGNLTTIWS